MNIWLIDPRNYTPYYDYSLCKALTEVGCQVRWLTRPYPYDQIENRHGLVVEYAFGHPTSVLVWSKNSFLTQSQMILNYLLSILQLIYRIWHESPQIVHIQWAAMPLIDQMLFWALRSMSTKLVYTVHNVLPHEVYRWHMWIYPHLYKYADKLIVHSYTSAHRLCKVFGLPTTQVSVIPQGNLSDFAEPVPKQRARHVLGLKDRTVILFFGIIRPYKGLQYLLLALPRVREAIPNVHLLVVGHVHRNDDLSRYRKLIEQYNLRDTVSLYPTFVPYKELGVYFGAADVVALPYLETTDSAVIPTAYTFARPVVTTTVGGLPEVVDSGKSGLLVPPGDEVALAEALIALLSDPHRCAQMGHYARHLAETKHSWESIASVTINVYRSLV